MENNDVMTILSRPGRLELRLQNLLERRGGVRVTSRLDGFQTGYRGRYRDRGDEHLTSLADLDSRISACRRELAAARNSAESILTRMAAMPDRPAARDAELLRLRYLRGQTWETVWQSLRARGWEAGNQRTVYNWGRAALRRAAAVLRSERDHAAG